LDDADLMTMCPAKVQTQNDSTVNTPPISTRALLLVLKNIEYNVKRNANLPHVIKSKGADGKTKMESMDSHIPKKPKKGGLDGETLRSVEEVWWAAQEP